MKNANNCLNFLRSEIIGQMNIQQFVFCFDNMFKYVHIFSSSSIISER